MATSFTQKWDTTVAGTGLINLLASSSTWTAGYEWFRVAATGFTNAMSFRHDGKIQVGTTPTTSTEIRIYLVASNDGTNWPDVFDGTPSAETATSEGVRDSFAKLAAVLRVDSTNSNRDYPYEFDAAQVFGGSLPRDYVAFVAHNTGVNLNGGASNHTYRYTPVYPYGQ